MCHPTRAIYDAIYLFIYLFTHASNPTRPLFISFQFPKIKFDDSLMSNIFVNTILQL